MAGERDRSGTSSRDEPPPAVADDRVAGEDLPCAEQLDPVSLDGQEVGPQVSVGLGQVQPGHSEVEPRWGEEKEETHNFCSVGRR